MSQTLEEIAERFKEAPRTVGEQFDSPDDDWIPVLFLCGEDGRIDLIGVGGDVSDDEYKDLLGHVILPSTIYAHKSKAYALLTSNWVASLKRDELSKRDTKILMRGGAYPPGMKRPSQRPDRIEALILQVVGVENDDVVEKMFAAEIYRDGVNPPTLSEWMTFEEFIDRHRPPEEAEAAQERREALAAKGEEPKGVETTGRLTEPLRRAFRLALTEDGPSPEEFAVGLVREHRERLQLRYQPSTYN